MTLRRQPKAVAARSAPQRRWGVGHLGQRVPDILCCPFLGRWGPTTASKVEVAKRDKKDKDKKKKDEPGRAGNRLLLRRVPPWGAGCAGAMGVSTVDPRSIQKDQANQPIPWK